MYICIYVYVYVYLYVFDNDRDSMSLDSFENKNCFIYCDDYDLMGKDDNTYNKSRAKNLRTNTLVFNNFKIIIITH